MKLRVVIDTSTLIGAALRSNSTPDRALRKALNEDTVCACLETISELQSVLARPKFDRYLDKETRRDFMTLVETTFRLFVLTGLKPSNVPPACRDSRDDIFLALALVNFAPGMKAEQIGIAAHNDLRVCDIVTPAEFLVR